MIVMINGITASQTVIADRFMQQELLPTIRSKKTKCAIVIKTYDGATYHSYI